MKSKLSRKNTLNHSRRNTLNNEVGVNTILAALASNAQRTFLRESLKGKFDDETIDKMTEDAANIVMVYEKTVKEYETSLQELKQELELLEKKLLHQDESNGKMKAIIAAKDLEIEELIEKVMTIRIEQAQEMNDIIGQFKKWENEDKIRKQQEDNSSLNRNPHIQAPKKKRNWFGI